MTVINAVRQKRNTFDMDAIKAAGYDVTTPLIVTNIDDYEEVKMLAEGTVNNSSEVLEVK